MVEWWRWRGSQPALLCSALDKLQLALLPSYHCELAVLCLSRRILYTYLSLRPCPFLYLFISCAIVHPPCPASLTTFQVNHLLDRQQIKTSRSQPSANMAAVAAAAANTLDPNSSGAPDGIPNDGTGKHTLS